VLEHGGRLRQAAQQSGIHLSDWLDLSTGINPDVYPIPRIDPACWQRLPEDGDGLEAAAAAYYGNDRLLALPGSQAAIQALPSLFRPAAVACISPIYEEHPQAWQRVGHQLRCVPSLQHALAASTPNILLCNPNNPTAAMQTRNAVLDATNQLKQRGGWMAVDEAFADAEPENSLVSLAGSIDAPNLIVFRSLGKFFGLAGARVGFLFGDPDKLDRLREMIGPWAVSHPSRAVAKSALADFAWHVEARTKLLSSSRRLADILAPLGVVGRTALFCTVRTPHVAAHFEYFARRAILTRSFEHHGLLRFGLPGSETEWQRLTSAVREMNIP